MPQKRVILEKAVPS